MEDWIEENKLGGAGQWRLYSIGLETRKEEAWDIEVKLGL